MVGVATAKPYPVGTANVQRVLLASVGCVYAHVKLRPMLGVGGTLGHIPDDCPNRRLQTRCTRPLTSRPSTVHVGQVDLDPVHFDGWLPGDQTPDRLTF